MIYYAIFQLADDKTSYGPDAGKFIVTSADHEEEFSGPMSQQDAEAFAATLNACQMIVDRWEKGDLAEAARACGSAISRARAGA